MNRSVADLLVCELAAAAAGSEAAGPRTSPKWPFSTRPPTKASLSLCPPRAPQGLTALRWQPRESGRPGVFVRQPTWAPLRPDRFEDPQEDRAFDIDSYDLGRAFRASPLTTGTTHGLYFQRECAIALPGRRRIRAVDRRARSGGRTPRSGEPTAPGQRVPLTHPRAQIRILG